MSEKVLSGNMNFLVINLSCFGDVLLPNTLCQNIKISYPDSKIIFITNSPFADAARYQKDVDEVYTFDKRGINKGLFGLIKFVNSFPYKNKIYASFVIYGNDRGIILSKLLNAKHIVSATNNFTKHLITDECSSNGFIHMQDINGEFLSAITRNKSKVLPIKVNPPQNQNKIADELNKIKESNDIIGLTLISDNPEKDMPLESAAELIRALNDINKVPVVFGVGKYTRKYVNELKKMGIIEFIDLVDVTSIADLMRVLKSCNALISIDTGTMHLACALNVPVIALFYKKSNVEKWAPRKSLYNCELLTENINAEKIINKLEELIKINNNTVKTKIVVNYLEDAK